MNEGSGAALPSELLAAATYTEHRWHAVRTRSRHEQVVRDQLAERCCDVFLPIVSRWSQWKHRRKRIEWPLFPGYCFAKFSLMDRLPVLTASGVVNVVSFAGQWAAISESEIESLRTLVNSECPYDPCPYVREGALVEVVRGALCGVTGRLIRKDLARARLVIAVDILGRAVSVDIAIDDVTPARR